MSRNRYQKSPNTRLLIFLRVPVPRDNLFSPQFFRSTMAKRVRFFEVNDNNQWLSVGTLPKKDVFKAERKWQEDGTIGGLTELCLNGEWYRFIHGKYFGESAVMVKRIKVPTYPMQRMNAVGPSTAVCEPPNQKKVHRAAKRARGRTQQARRMSPAPTPPNQEPLHHAAKRARSRTQQQ